MQLVTRIKTHDDDVQHAARKRPEFQHRSLVAAWMLRTGLRAWSDQPTGTALRRDRHGRPCSSTGEPTSPLPMTTSPSPLPSLLAARSGSTSNLEPGTSRQPSSTSSNQFARGMPSRPGRHTRRSPRLTGAASAFRLPTSPASQLRGGGECATAMSMSSRIESSRADRCWPSRGTARPRRCWRSLQQTGSHRTSRPSIESPPRPARHPGASARTARERPPIASRFSAR